MTSPRAVGVAAASAAAAVELIPVALVVWAATSGSLGSFESTEFLVLTGTAAAIISAAVGVLAAGHARRLGPRLVADPGLMWGAVACGAGVLAFAQALVPAVILAVVGLDENESVQPRMWAIESWWLGGQIAAMVVALAAGRLTAGPPLPRHTAREAGPVAP